MKTTFETNRTSTSKLIGTVREAITVVKEFLHRNGIPSAHLEDYVVSSQSEVVIRMDCSNINFTRAVSLLTLLSTLKDSPFYIKYRVDPITPMMLCSNGDTYKDVIPYLQKNWKITIED